MNAAGKSILSTHIQAFRLGLSLALPLALPLALCLVFAAAPAPAKDKFVFQSLVPQLDPLPPPKVLKGNIVESNMLPPPATNAFGYAEDKPGFPSRVTYVAPNSVAWRGGLQPADRILNGRVEPSRAVLIVERGGKKYACILRLGEISGRPDTPGGGPGGNNKLTGKAEKAENQALSNYAIAMVVDNSASMGTKDCAGGASRWQWCKDHIGELYIESSGLLQKNISIVTFDSNFRSRRNCSPSELQSVFNLADPAGETNMGPALDEAFQLVRRQLDMGRPAIVSVISDGRPSDADRVKQAIIREVNGLPKPELLSIVFIEVGTPEHYLKELDNDLVKQGARADIVKVIPFSSVNTQGLSKTLADTLPKPVEKTATLSGAAASGENRARQAIAGHIYTYNSNGNGGGNAGASTKPRPQPVAAPPVRPRPPVVAAPPVKAHPAGTPPDGQTSVAKPVEVDEREQALRRSVNKIYK